ncbi:hypothetical protein [Notoacmeibacter sp. MSK16QG-6]|uniref:hypothetical protein n=1 Tax=Notoacmeibacter sp. MSK16QG-6 TaxID=2957982 RepID=UPI00209E164D|nr:hypothetical protein [Notoacmeibacter sp. MSK16QG-6]MCP1200057.1 hypothetical protein [Notoacmeibacter sp. MSK16QG-6]
MITAKIEPFDINTVLPTRGSDEERSRMLASFAREQLGEALARNTASAGSAPRYEKTVDHRRGAPEESVKPDGVIVYEFELVSGILEWIGDMLVKNSPVLTGRYARSHIVLADGIETDPAMPEAEAREYVFLNTVPYARKIERGLSAQAADGVYQGVAVMASKRAGNIARIRFSYRTLAGGSQKDKAARQPAIVVVPY